VLGSEVARVVYGEEDPEGGEIEGLRIIGVLAPLPEDDPVREPLNRRVLVSPGAAPRGGLDARTAKGYWALWIRPASSIDAAIRAISSLVPDLVGVVRLPTRYGRAFATEQRANRFFLLLATAGLFGLAGTIVAGTLSLSSLSRRWEIGVRRAIGAGGPDIARLVLDDNLALTLGGGLFGILLALASFPVASQFGTSLRLGALHLAVPPLPTALGLSSAAPSAVRSARLAPAQALSGRLERGTTATSCSARASSSSRCPEHSSLAPCQRSLFSQARRFVCSPPCGETSMSEPSSRLRPVRASSLYPPELAPDGGCALAALTEPEAVVVTEDRSLRSIAGVNRLGLSITARDPAIRTSGCSTSSPDMT